VKRLILASLFASGAVLAGPFDQPYSQVLTDRKPSADPNVIPAIINRIDDVQVHNKGVIAPGMHKITVDVPPRKGYPATQVSFDLETKPCTTYYVNARLKSRTLQEWEPFVKYTERLKDCEAKFNVTGEG